MRARLKVLEAALHPFHGNTKGAREICHQNFFRVDMDLDPEPPADVWDSDAQPRFRHFQAFCEDGPHDMRRLARHPDRQRILTRIRYGDAPARLERDSRDPACLKSLCQCYLCLGEPRGDVAEDLRASKEDIALYLEVDARCRRSEGLLHVNYRF